MLIIKIMSRVEMALDLLFLTTADITINNIIVGFEALT